MVDYSEFPFDQLTTDEIVQLMIGSVKVNDALFAKACREQLKVRRPSPAAQVSASTGECTCDPPDGYPHLPSCSLFQEEQ